MTLGIDNLKKLIGFGLRFTKQTLESTGDGWQWTDFFSFIDEAAEIPGVAKALPAALDELNDLSEDERLELMVFVKNEFDIADDQLEETVEDALAWALSTYNLIKRFKK